jgi:hypothetical protein
MPKLTSNVAQKTAEAEGGNFEPLPENTYLAVPEEVTMEPGGANGPYWKWTFKIAEGQEYAGRKLFMNTSLSEKALWKLKETFEAFGVSTDTDTDDLIGKPVKLYVVQRPIEQGKRKGEIGNEIRNLLPADGTKAASASGAKGAAKADDVPLF